MSDGNNHARAPLLVAGLIFGVVLSDKS